MAEPKKVIRTALLPLLQLSLGLFLIMKTTPLWAVIHCSIAYFLDCCHFPYTDYKQLRGFEGRVFKRVISHATTAGEVSKVKKHKDPNRAKDVGDMNADSEISVNNYLGKTFLLKPNLSELERPMGGMKMQVSSGLKPKDGEKPDPATMKKGPVYYITDKMWEHLKYIEKAAGADADQGTVFVKNHKEIWEEVVTGDIMEFEEVLDSVILDNRAVVRLDHDYFLPVNLLLTEDKLRATLNFVGIFLQTQKQVHWIISASLSLTAALMGFSTTLRLSVIGRIDKIICRGVQFVCDVLPFAMRRFIYSWTSWVPGLKPSNDIQAKIIKGDVVQVLVGGGAKFHSKSKIDPISFADSLLDEVCSEGGPVLIGLDPKHDKFYIEWKFDKSKCSLKVGRVASNCQKSSLKEIGRTCIVYGEGVGGTKRKVMFFKSDDSHSVPVKIDSCKQNKKSVMADGIHTASVDIDCSTEEAIQLLKFACCMAELKSGSLKSYDSESQNVFVRRFRKSQNVFVRRFRKSQNVFVRRFVESINAYVRSGYPPLHKLELNNVVVR